MTDLEADEYAADFLTLKELGLDVKIRLSEPLEIPSHDSARNLLAISNEYGLLFAATPSGFVVVDLAELRLAFNSAKRSTKPPLDSPKCAVDVEDAAGSGAMVTFLTVADGETRLLAGLADGRVLIWDIDSFASGAKPPPVLTVNAFEGGQRLIELTPNPSGFPELCAALYAPAQSTSSHSLDAGAARLLDVRSGQWREKELCSNCTALCWSAKGKRIAAGLASGEIQQLTPDGDVKDTIAPPPELSQQGSYHVSDLLWTENESMSVTYSVSSPEPSDDPDHRDELFVILHDTKATPSTTYVKVAMDPAPPFGDSSRAGRRFRAWLRNWNPMKHIIFTASVPSTDVGAIGCLSNQSGPEAWKLLELEETSRPVLPFSSVDNATDTSPFGLALDLTAVEDVDDPTAMARGEDGAKLPPVPVLYIYTNDGVLLGYHVINAEPGAGQYAGVIGKPPKSVSASAVLPQAQQVEEIEPAAAASETKSPNPPVAPETPKAAIPTFSFGVPEAAEDAPKSTASAEQAVSQPDAPSATTDDRIETNQPAAVSLGAPQPTTDDGEPAGSAEDVAAVAPASQATTTGFSFGSGSSTFGVNAFSKPVTTSTATSTTAAPAFGQTSAFGQGTTVNAFSKPAGTSPAPTAFSFGQTSAFSPTSSASAPKPAFGQNSPFGASAFGKSSPFGQSALTTSAFGSASPFGKTSESPAASPSSGSTAAKPFSFGTPSQSGGSSAFAAASGSSWLTGTATATKSAFGSGYANGQGPPPVFGERSSSPAQQEQTRSRDQSPASDHLSEKSAESEDEESASPAAPSTAAPQASQESEVNADAGAANNVGGADTSFSLAEFGSALGVSQSEKQPNEAVVEQDEGASPPVPETTSAPTPAISEPNASSEPPEAGEVTLDEKSEEPPMDIPEPQSPASAPDTETPSAQQPAPFSSGLPKAVAGASKPVGNTTEASYGPGKQPAATAFALEPGFSKPPGTPATATNATVPGFGQPSAFGQTSTQSAFSTPSAPSTPAPTTSALAFGQPSAFGQGSTVNAFSKPAASSPAAPAPAFGQPSAFGQSSTPSAPKPAFGTGSSFGQTSTFGASAFGKPSAFGQSPAVASAFGSSTPIKKADEVSAGSEAGKPFAFGTTTQSGGSSAFAAASGSPSGWLSDKTTAAKPTAFGQGSGTGQSPFTGFGTRTLSSTRQPQESAREQSPESDNVSEEKSAESEDEQPAATREATLHTPAPAAVELKKTDATEKTVDKAAPSFSFAGFGAALGGAQPEKQDSKTERNTTPAFGATKASDPVSAFGQKPQAGADGAAEGKPSPFSFGPGGGFGGNAFAKSSVPVASTSSPAPAFGQASEKQTPPVPGPSLFGKAALAGPSTASPFSFGASSPLAPAAASKSQTSEASSLSTKATTPASHQQPHTSSAANASPAPSSFNTQPAKGFSFGKAPTPSTGLGGLTQSSAGVTASNPAKDPDSSTGVTQKGPSPFSFGPKPVASTAQPTPPAPAPFSRTERTKFGSNNGQQSIQNGTSTAQPQQQMAETNRIGAANEVPQGIASEAQRVFLLMEDELANLKTDAEACGDRLPEKGPSKSSARTFADLSDHSKWSFADIAQMLRLTSELHDDADSLKDEEADLRAQLKILQDQQIKAEVKRQEVDRLLKARSDPALAQELRVHELGPEHQDNRIRLRNGIQSTRTAISELEQTMDQLKKRIQTKKDGKRAIEVPPLDTMQRATRNITRRLQEQLGRLSLLEGELKATKSPVDDDDDVSDDDRDFAFNSKQIKQASSAQLVASRDPFLPPPADPVAVQMRHAQRRAKALKSVFVAAQKVPILNMSSVNPGTNSGDLDKHNEEVQITLARGPVQVSRANHQRKFGSKGLTGSPPLLSNFAGKPTAPPDLALPVSVKQEPTSPVLPSKETPAFPALSFKPPALPSFGTSDFTGFAPLSNDTAFAPGSRNENASSGHRGIGKSKTRAKAVQLSNVTSGETASFFSPSPSGLNAPAPPASSNFFAAPFAFSAAAQKPTPAPSFSFAKTEPGTSQGFGGSGTSGAQRSFFDWAQPALPKILKASKAEEEAAEQENRGEETSVNDKNRPQQRTEGSISQDGGSEDEADGDYEDEGSYQEGDEEDEGWDGEEDEEGDEDYDEEEDGDWQPDEDDAALEEEEGEEEEEEEEGLSAVEEEEEET
ncbi:hypothetical protein OC845_004125 [Tilletia horrida]|nr:hypothetical protein OC845_004125 [Tilletia horrida]